MAIRRSIYRKADLVRLFNPRSIAVVGASSDPKSIGWRTAFNLRSFNNGPVMLVNPKHDCIDERPCYPSIQALPQTPDCVVIATPRHAVEDAVIECANRGVGGAVIYAAGYAETNQTDRVAAQQRLEGITNESGLKLLGPNCIGYVNLPNRTVVSFARSDYLSQVECQSGVAVVSQSGAIGFGLLQGVRRGVAMSHVIASGNSCNLDIADEIGYLIDEPSCKAIVCILEGLSDPSRLLEAGELAWAANKRIIVCKLGTSDQGAAAALSHSGSLAGSLDAYRAAFARVGIVMVNDLDRVVETASFFAKAPTTTQPKGVGIVALSGGAAISATDKAAAHGVPLPQPTECVRENLLRHIPEFGAARNPCDATAMAGFNPEILFRACADMASDPQFGVIVLPYTSAGEDAGERLNFLGEVCRREGKLLCVPWLSSWLGGPGSKEAEMNANIALFHSVDHCFATIAAWHSLLERRELAQTRGPRRPIRQSSVKAGEEAEIAIRSSPVRTISERESKAILAGYGVEVVPEKFVRTSQQAVAAAQEMGFPVALKIESPDIPHKTEVGGIRLNLRDATEVRRAFAEITERIGQVQPPPRIAGLLVQPMVSPQVEIMVGAKIDPLFGPVILVGIGGIMVELLQDIAVELAPVTVHEARAMLDGLKASALLNGFRGSAPINLDLLVQSIVRLSEFIDDQQDLIAEFDVNPLICAGGRVLAVDALIVKK